MGIHGPCLSDHGTEPGARMRGPWRSLSHAARTAPVTMNTVWRIDGTGGVRAYAPVWRFVRQVLAHRATGAGFRCDMDSEAL